MPVNVFTFTPLRMREKYCTFIHVYINNISYKLLSAGLDSYKNADVSFIGT